jgi:hypothetical protein
MVIPLFLVPTKNILEDITNKRPKRDKAQIKKSKMAQRFVCFT